MLRVITKFSDKYLLERKINGRKKVALKWIIHERPVSNFAREAAKIFSNIQVERNQKKTNAKSDQVF